MQVLAVQPVMYNCVSLRPEVLLETSVGPCAGLHSLGIAVLFLHFSKASLLQPQLSCRSSVSLLTARTRSWGSAEGGRQPEPRQATTKGLVSPCYLTLPFIDVIQAHGTQMDNSYWKRCHSSFWAMQTSLMDVTPFNVNQSQGLSYFHVEKLVQAWNWPIRAATVTIDVYSLHFSNKV